MGRHFQPVLQGFSKQMATGIITGSSKEIIWCLSWKGHSSYCVYARIADWARWQPCIEICIEWRIKTQIRKTQWVGPPGPLGMIEPQGILYSRISIQLHPNIQTVQKTRMQSGAFHHQDCFSLNDRCKSYRIQLVNPC